MRKVPLSHAPSVPAATNDPTFAEIWKIYLDLHVTPYVSASQRIHFVGTNLLPVFGARKISSLRPQDFQTYAAGRQSGKFGRKVTGSTVRRELNAMVAAMNFCAHKQRCIPAIIVPFVPLPAAAPAKEVWLKKDELDDFIKKVWQLHDNASQPLSRIYRFVMLATQTAARRSAIAELKWSQVDLENRIIKFNPTGRVQTAKKRPVVPISDALLRVLERAKDEKTTEYVLDHPGDVAKLFERAAKATGYSHVTPHVLRHTWATHAAIDGVDTWKIAGVLGDNEVTVRKNYLHYAPDYLRDAVNR